MHITFEGGKFIECRAMLWMHSHNCINNNTDKDSASVYSLVSSLFFASFRFLSSTCNSIWYNVKTLKSIAFFLWMILAVIFFFQNYENFSMFELNSFRLFNFTFLNLHTQKNSHENLLFSPLFVFFEFNSFQTFLSPLRLNSTRAFAYSFSQCKPVSVWSLQIVCRQTCPILLVWVFV